MKKQHKEGTCKVLGRSVVFSAFYADFCFCSKLVIITTLMHKMLKIQQIFPKLYRCLLYVVFHNLKPQNAGLVDVKKDLNSNRSKGIFVRENLKNKHSY